MVSPHREAARRRKVAETDRSKEEHCTDRHAGISADELESRRERLLTAVRDTRQSGYVLFDADSIRYLTGFRFLATERPVVLAQSAAGELAVLVPGFEVARGCAPRARSSGSRRTRSTRPRAPDADPRAPALTPIEAGRVLSVEPGLYAPEIGGFRLSDTVAVTPDGIDILTSYPSDLESLTIPV